MHITDHGRTEVADVDLKDYFNTIPHGPSDALRGTPYRRRHSAGGDQGWLTAPVIERDKRGRRVEHGGQGQQPWDAAGRSYFAIIGESVLPSLSAGVERPRIIATQLGPTSSTMPTTSSSAVDPATGKRPGDDAALMTRLGLTVNEDKTRLVRIPDGSFDFLGYTIGRFHGRDGGAYIGTRPSRKAVRVLLRKIHEQRRRRRTGDAGTPG